MRSAQRNRWEMALLVLVLALVLALLGVLFFIGIPFGG